MLKMVKFSAPVPRVLGHVPAPCEGSVHFGVVAAQCRIVFGDYEDEHVRESLAIRNAHAAFSAHGSLNFDAAQNLEIDFQSNCNWSS